MSTRVQETSRCGESSLNNSLGVESPLKQNFDRCSSSPVKQNFGFCHRNEGYYKKVVVTFFMLAGVVKTLCLASKGISN